MSGYQAALIAVLLLTGLGTIVGLFTATCNGITHIRNWRKQP